MKVMKKNLYIQPQTQIVKLGFQQHLLAGSNQFQGSSVELNSATMEGGDGGDGASRGSSLWSDDDY
jgi:hypothetical protein